MRVIKANKAKNAAARVQLRKPLRTPWAAQPSTASTKNAKRLVSRPEEAQVAKGPDAANSAGGNKEAGPCKPAKLRPRP